MGFHVGTPRLEAFFFIGTILKGLALQLCTAATLQTEIERERERERGEFFNEKSISRRRMIFEQLSLSFVKEKEKKLATQVGVDHQFCSDVANEITWPSTESESILNALYSLLPAAFEPREQFNNWSIFPLHLPTVDLFNCSQIIF